jgi:cell fate regulator YaaT (PSP1 superfamily)
MIPLAIVGIPGLGCFEARVPGGLDPRPGETWVVERHGVAELGLLRRRRAARERSVAETALEVRLLRVAGAADLEQERANAAMALEVLRAFAAETAGAPQGVRGTMARFSLDRARLTVAYRAERPYDGRRFAAAMERRHGAEVVLRQIGVRDEAALLGGLGDCGRPLCCATWMRRFSSVNVRMAREQGLSISPAGVNGACGRLKCCLCHEHEVYRQAAAGLPEEGATVTLADGGEGIVEERHLLRGTLKVRSREGRLLRLQAAEVRWKDAAAPAPAADENEETDEDAGTEADHADTGDQRAQPETAGNT